ncbi:hypothetical protein LCGC14_0592500 [marine sediment metagenome]|uniref:MAE-28990/MAE-18760-like HEPN domain-containing protein n=1 Tax=marine sediment metagenome TaxID=412755 RepID=A0A0F9RHZ9_9ZZZZ|nr:hypothetical protein [Candidatus Aminicenantes bacterium]
MACDNKLYQFHVANIRSVEIALNNTALSARKAISAENAPAVESFIRLYALLLGAWVEIRLKKLLFENSGFSVEERSFVFAQSAQLEQWHKVVELAFRKHYNLPNAKLTDTTLPFTAYARYETLKEILDSDLKSIIEVRNKLAHGQWIYPLNSEGTDVEENKYQLLNNENLPSLQYKKGLISGLSNIVHDLVVSLQTFERDFDANYQKITDTRNNLKNRSYEKYAYLLVEKRRKGVEKRRANKT